MPSKEACTRFPFVVASFRCCSTTISVRNSLEKSLSDALPIWRVKIACDRDDSSFICVAPVCRTLDPFFSRLTMSLIEWHACSLAPMTTKSKNESSWMRSERCTCIAQSVVPNIQRFIRAIQKVDDIIFVNLQIRCGNVHTNIGTMLGRSAIGTSANERVCGQNSLLGAFEKWYRQLVERCRIRSPQSIKCFHRSS